MVTSKLMNRLTQNFTQIITLVMSRCRPKFKVISPVLGQGICEQGNRAVAGNHSAMRDTCTWSLHLILWQRTVAAWYHGTPGQSSRNSGNTLRLARPPTRPNFVALRQKECEIFAVKHFRPRKSRPTFTLGHQICHQSIGRTRISIETL